MRRVAQLLAFAYDFIWAIVFLALGIGITVAGVVRAEYELIGIGLVITVATAAYIAFDIWPSRRTKT